MKYELRENDIATMSGSFNPERRGILIATFDTYREAFRRWQELNAAGRDVYVIRKAD